MLHASSEYHPECIAGKLAFINGSEQSSELQNSKQQRCKDGSGSMRSFAHGSSIVPGSIYMMTTARPAHVEVPSLMQTVPAPPIVSTNMPGA